MVEVAPVIAAVVVHRAEGIGWFTLSLLNAGIAQSKNRSGLNWWLLSIFLGPIATFILVAFCEKLPEA